MHGHQVGMAQIDGVWVGRIIVLGA